jgi:hypothetical protein
LLRELCVNFSRKMSNKRKDEISFKEYTELHNFNEMFSRWICTCFEMNSDDPIQVILDQLKADDKRLENNLEMKTETLKPEMVEQEQPAVKVTICIDSINEETLRTIKRKKIKFS